MILLTGTSGLMQGMMMAMEANGIMPCWFQCWVWLLSVSDIRNRIKNSNFTLHYQGLVETGLSSLFLKDCLRMSLT